MVTHFSGWSSSGHCRHRRHCRHLRPSVETAGVITVAIVTSVHVTRTLQICKEYMPLTKSFVSLTGEKIRYFRRVWGRDALFDEWLESMSEGCWTIKLIMSHRRSFRIAEGDWSTSSAYNLIVARYWCRILHARDQIQYASPSAMISPSNSMAMIDWCVRQNWPCMTA